MVTKVEFQSNGNKAYAWVKSSDKAGEEGARIRIGEGYPDEQGDGWSSPLWVVRALNDRNVSLVFFVCFLSRHVTIGEYMYKCVVRGCDEGK